jgi:methyl-accepting chemotaxis protein
MSLSIGKKMALGFVFPVLVILAGLAAGVWTLARIEARALLVKTESYPMAGVAAQMRLDVVEVQQYLTDVSATRAQDGLGDGFQKAEEAARSFSQGLAKFEEMFQREKDQANLERTAKIKAEIGRAHV